MADFRTLDQCLVDIEDAARRIREIGGAVFPPQRVAPVEEKNVAEEAPALSPEEFMAEHPVGFLHTPANLDKMEQFVFGGPRFVSPLTINNTDWNLRPKDQGSKPHCAGYAAACYIENLLWRKTGVPEEVDGDAIYREAKKIDRCPTMSGTSLTAALQAGLNLGYFKDENCSVKVLRTIEQVKRCIHRFGTCLIGVMVTREYYSCNKRKTAVCGEGDQTLMGGHALQAVGFKKGGLIARNSWGEAYGTDGDIIIAWEQLARQFCYGATYDNPLANFHI